MNIDIDQDAVVAAADLVGRSGATDFQVGYLHDDVPLEEAGWYAHAQYRGARISVEDHPGPVEACEALARRIFDGARCAHCAKRVRLTDSAPGCRWRRIGDRWARGCEKKGRRRG